MITDDITDIDLGHYDVGYEDGYGNETQQSGQPAAYYAGYKQGRDDYELETGTGIYATQPGGRKPEKIPGVIPNKPRKNNPYHPSNMGNPFHWD